MLVSAGLGEDAGHVAGRERTLQRREVVPLDHLGRHGGIDGAGTGRRLGFGPGTPSLMVMIVSSMEPVTAGSCRRTDLGPRVTGGPGGRRNDWRRSRSGRAASTAGRSGPRNAPRPPTEESSVGSIVVMPRPAWAAMAAAGPFGECPVMAPVSPRQKSTYSCPSTQVNRGVVRLGHVGRERARPARHPVHGDAVEHVPLRAFEELARAWVARDEGLVFARLECREPLAVDDLRCDDPSRDWTA